MLCFTNEVTKITEFAPLYEPLINFKKKCILIQNIEKRIALWTTDIFFSVTDKYFDSK